MRLPKLVSQLFHRRSKSDTVLTVTHAKPHVALLPTSTSWPYQNDEETSTNPPSLSGILASISTEPVPLSTTLPLPALPLPPVPSTEVSIIGSGWSIPWLMQTSSLNGERPSNHPHTSESQSEACASEVEALETALQMERSLHDDTITENKQLTRRITDLQADIQKLRGELLNSLKKSAGNSEPLPNNDLLKTLKGENARLRKFVSLMVSASAHKSILEVALKRTLDGEDPEMAVVHALREDTGTIGGILRTLLEPMLGPRSPQDYLAQVQCTLGARRESRNWRKKASFWKNNARQEGKHLDTVTPSVSALSDIVDELPPDRQTILDKNMEKLRKGTLSLLVEKQPATVSIPPSESDKTSPPSRLSIISVPTPLPPLVESIEEAVPPVFEPTQEVLTVSDVILNEPISSESAATLRSRRSSRLEPLASVAFCETNHIKRRESFNSRRNSLASSRGLMSSGSLSSQGSGGSKRSARRKVKILAVSVSEQSTSKASSTTSRKGVSTKQPDSEGNRSDSFSPGSSPQVLSQTSIGSDTISSKRLSSLSSTTSPPETPTKFSPEISTLTKNVLSASFTTLRTKTHGSPNPKKSPSRLPILKIPRPSIRRLSISSISKPVLVDTTNAAAIPSTGVNVSKRKIQSPPISNVGKKAVMERNATRGGKGKLVLRPKPKKGVMELGIKESRIGKFGTITAR